MSHTQKLASEPGAWKPYLDLYDDVRAVQFSSQAQYAAAAKILWNELRDVPFDIVGQYTIIVPLEACRFFEGLEFSETEVLTPQDVSPEELAQLRKECGPY